MIIKNKCGRIIFDGKKANLSRANLSDANLSDADLSRANLSGTKGLLNPIDFLEKNFKKNQKGYIVYKTFGEFQSKIPENWKIEESSIIKEIVNFDRCVTCACGVNVATLEWVKKECKNEIWKCLIEFKWLAGVCVPYNTDGKIRASKVRILKKYRK